MRRLGLDVTVWVEGELPDLPVVLVVEDEEPLQEIVHDALKEGGFDLTTVASGKEAMAMMCSEVFGARNRRQPQGADEGLGYLRANPSRVSRNLHDGCGC
jgi:ActR/RegA family two-component response regulator